MIDTIAMIVGYIVIACAALFSLSWCGLRVVEYGIRSFGMWSICVEIMSEIVKRRRTK